MSYQINDYIRVDNKQSEIYSMLYQNMQDVFKEMEIEIMSPHYRATSDGNSTTIPKKYTTEDHKLPNFDVITKENKKNEP